MNVNATSMKAGFTTMDRLIETAQKEGTLTVVGLPREWLNYAEIMDTFTDKYGVKVNVVHPEATGTQAVAQTGADVFDVSLEVALANAAAFAPYRVTGWQDIPDQLKDLSGAWAAGYGGYMSIATTRARSPLRRRTPRCWRRGTPRRGRWRCRVTRSRRRPGSVA